MNGPDTARVTAWVEEASTRIERAYDEVVRLCQGGQWTMRVPVDEARDSDTVLAAALTDAGKLLAVVRGVAELAERQAAAAELPVLKGDRYDAGVAAAYRDSAEQIARLLADAAPDTEKEKDR